MTRVYADPVRTPCRRLGHYFFVPFPVSLNVYPFHHYPFMNAMFSVLLGGGLTHTGAVRTGGSRGQRCSSLVGISHINMHANDSTVYALPLKSAHCSKGSVRDKIRRADVVAVVGRTNVLQASAPSAIPANWSRRFAFRSQMPGSRVRRCIASARCRI